VCQAQDGCISGINDNIQITADDFGYEGLGGPLTATETINVSIM
jgi:hypothetical protein